PARPAGHDSGRSRCHQSRRWWRATQGVARLRHFAAVACRQPSEGSGPTMARPHPAAAPDLAWRVTWYCTPSVHQLYPSLRRPKMGGRKASRSGIALSPQKEKKPRLEQGTPAGTQPVARRKVGLIIHATVYAAVNVLLITINLSTAPGQ